MTKADDSRSGWLPAVATFCIIGGWWWHSSSVQIRGQASGERQSLVPSYSLSELRAFIGEGEDETVLLAVWGRVFNVTSAPEFYAKGGGYHVFAGHDCTRAFAISSTKDKWLDMNLEGLKPKKIKHLNETYWGPYVEKYPIVGRLTDPPYDASAYDEYAGPYSQIQVHESVRPRPSQPTGAKRESKCPVTRAARAVGSAVMSLLPRQLAAPSWAGGGGAAPAEETGPSGSEL